MNDNTSSLTQLHKLIRSLRKQEIEQIQQIHADALMRIATIARENNLSLEHIQIAMSVRAPKAIRAPRTSKRSKPNRSEVASDVAPAASTI
jgi:dephospho-CoA kinase